MTKTLPIFKNFDTKWTGLKKEEESAQDCKNGWEMSENHQVGKMARFRGFEKESFEE